MGKLRSLGQLWSYSTLVAPPKQATQQSGHPHAFPDPFPAFLTDESVSGCLSASVKTITGGYTISPHGRATRTPPYLNVASCLMPARIGLPYSDTLVDRTLLEVSGTILAARLALEFGLACNLAGGTHHAHKSFGSG